MANRGLKIEVNSPVGGRTRYSIHRVCDEEHQAAGIHPIFESVDSREVHAFITGWIEASHAIECGIMVPSKRLSARWSW